MSSIFNTTITVVKDDLDELEHVNNVRYVQWIQDISKEHWIRIAPEEIRSKVVWVVLHHDITYKASARYGDKIKIRTHIEKSHGAVSVRIVEMFDYFSDTLLVRSSTKWCLLKRESLRPTRISGEIIQLFSE